jgi:hypothetical protein
MLFNKKNMNKLFTVLCLVWACISQISHAQVYADEQLRIETESRDAAKKKFISENPDAYRKSGGNPEDIISIQRSENISKPTPVLPELKNYFKAESITVSDLSGFKNESERIKYGNEATSEFELNQFYISLEEGKLIKQNRKTGLFTIYEITVDNSLIKIECDKCDFPPFRLMEFTSQKLVYAEKSQDEGTDFEFIYTFTK